MTQKINLSLVLKRELRGKTLSHVAKEIGIPVSLLHDWHSSSRMPSAKNLVKLAALARYLNMSLEEILFDYKAQRNIVCTTYYEEDGKSYKVCIEKLD